MGHDKVTLRDVAQAAGVSLATASQALRNEGATARSTCARVQRIATELGYRPDPIIARLASKRFRAPAQGGGAPIMFVAARSGSALDGPWRYLEDVGARATLRGYRVHPAEVESRETLRREARRWFYRGVRGVVLSRFEMDEWIEDIDWSPFSVVFLGGRCPRVLFNTVKVDVVLGAQWALERLERSVSGRIGVILHRHPYRLGDDDLREGAVRNWMERLAPERRVPILFLRFGTPYPEQLELVRAWLKAHRPAGVAGIALARQLVLDTGVFPEVADRVIVLMHAGEDRRLGMIGCLEPTQTGANRAVDLLDSMIRHGETGKPASPVQILVPPLWVERDGEPKASPQAGR